MREVVQNAEPQMRLHRAIASASGEMSTHSVRLYTRTTGPGQGA